MSRFLMKTFRSFYHIILLLSFIIFSCKKDNTIIPDFTANLNVNPPIPAVADGILIAAKTRTTSMQIGIPVTVLIGKSIASFFSTPGDNSILVNAGEVKCENKSLTIRDKNVYNNDIGLTNPTGINFGSNLSWDIGGNTLNNINSFNQTYFNAFPIDFDISSNDILNKSSDYTINTSTTIGNSDGMIFIIASQKGEVVTKYLAPNTSSNIFTSAELSKLGTGKGVVNVSAWKGNIEDKAGKKYFFVREVVASKEIDIK